MTRTDIINELINYYKYKSYLEIGTSSGDTFHNVKCFRKVGIDPDKQSSTPVTTYFITSDEYFAKYHEKFDLIFIDGLHKSEQVIRDIKNSLRCINEGGTIVIHDCNPANSWISRDIPDFDSKALWTGDVYKAFIHFRRYSNLSLFCIDADFGVGVIQKGTQVPLKIDNPTFDDFDRNRTLYLNLISSAEFVKRFQIPKMQHFFGKIQGWCNFTDFYEKMVFEAPENAHFVEIGTWLGRSTAFMGVEIYNSRKNIKFDAIDTFEGSKNGNDEEVHNHIAASLDGTIYENFLRNIEPIKSIVNPIKSDSVKASKKYKDNSLDFVFIDGGHTYEDCKRDINAWWPKLKENGILGGDDYGWSGVERAVNEKFGKQVRVSDAWYVIKRDLKVIPDKSKIAIWVIDIDNYRPEITQYTLPKIYKYAEKIGAEVRMISERKYHDWPFCYEQMQVWQEVPEYYYNLYIDLDVLISENMMNVIDLHETKSIDSVISLENCDAATYFKYEEDFKKLPILLDRYGKRNVMGISGNFVLTSYITQNIYKPGPYEFKDIEDRATIPWIINEYNMTRNAAINRYALYNMGTLIEDRDMKLVHLATESKKQGNEIQLIKRKLKEWGEE